jgi:hypothetical protein
VSFWLPGQYGSFAAVPSDPGWSFENSFYHASAEASRGISFERGGAIQAGMKSPSDFFMFTPTYAFKTPILGAQAAFGTTILYGKNATSVSATLAGPGGNSTSGSRSDEVTNLLREREPTQGHTILCWQKIFFTSLSATAAGVQK